MEYQDIKQKLRSLDHRSFVKIGDWDVSKLKIHGKVIYQASYEGERFTKRVKKNDPRQMAGFLEEVIDND